MVKNKLLTTTQIFEQIAKNIVSKHGTSEMIKFKGLTRVSIYTSYRHADIENWEHFYYSHFDICEFNNTLFAIGIGKRPGLFSDELPSGKDYFESDIIAFPITEDEYLVVNHNAEEDYRRKRILTSLGTDLSKEKIKEYIKPYLIVTKSYLSEPEAGIRELESSILYSYLSGDFIAGKRYKKYFGMLKERDSREYFDFYPDISDLISSNIKIVKDKKIVLPWKTQVRMYKPTIIKPLTGIVENALLDYSKWEIRPQEMIH